MADKQAVWRGLAVATISVGLSSALAPAAVAGEWEFTLHGIFNGTTTDPMTGMGSPVITDTISGTGAPTLTANEPFTLTAVFNSSNVVFNFFTGFNAYAPNWVNLTVGGNTYSVQTYSQNSTSGFTVALFDKTSMFGGDQGKPDNHVAAGFLANPPADGAGIITDFTDGSPADYSVYSLTNILWPKSNYFGVGFGSGPCPSGTGPGGVCLPLNNPPPNTVVPIPLDGGTFDLTLGTYDLNNTSNGIPVNPNDNLFSASLRAVPEPSTWALLLAGFSGLGIAGLRRLRTKRLAA